MWIAPAVLGQPHLLFVRRGDILLRCSDASDRVAAALLGRFLPRLGPLGFLAALFFWIGASQRDSALTLGTPAKVYRTVRSGRCRADCCYAARTIIRRPPGRGAA